MFDVIARQYCAGNAAGRELAARYLRENLLFDMTPRAVDGLLTFYDEAARLGLVEITQPLEFFGEA
jgi:hypothetical protein